MKDVNRIKCVVFMLLSVFSHKPEPIQATATLKLLAHGEVEALPVAPIDQVDVAVLQNGEYLARASMFKGLIDPYIHELKHRYQVSPTVKAKLEGADLLVECIIAESAVLRHTGEYYNRRPRFELIQMHPDDEQVFLDISKDGSGFEWNAPGYYTIQELKRTFPTEHYTFNFRGSGGRDLPITIKPEYMDQKLAMKLSKDILGASMVLMGWCGEGICTYKLAQPVGQTCCVEVYSMVLQNMRDKLRAHVCIGIVFKTEEDIPWNAGQNFSISGSTLLPKGDCHLYQIRLGPKVFQFSQKQTILLNRYDESIEMLREVICKHFSDSKRAGVTPAATYENFSLLSAFGAAAADFGTVSRIERKRASFASEPKVIRAVNAAQVLNE